MTFCREQVGLVLILVVDRVGELLKRGDDDDDDGEHWTIVSLIPTLLGVTFS